MTGAGDRKVTVPFGAHGGMGTVTFMRFAPALEGRRVKVTVPAPRFAAARRIAMGGRIALVGAGSLFIGLFRL
jgi:hypothetical protein